MVNTWIFGIGEAVAALCLIGGLVWIACRRRLSGTAAPPVPLKLRVDGEGPVQIPEDGFGEDDGAYVGGIGDGDLGGLGTGADDELAAPCGGYVVAHAVTGATVSGKSRTQRSAGQASQSPPLMPAPSSRPRVAPSCLQKTGT